MKLATALLCDHASVRDGLLFITGGGITRLWRDEYPAPMKVSLALMIELHPIELERPHELEVIVQDEDGQRFAELKAGFQHEGQGGNVPPGETAMAPLALDLYSVGITHAGAYSVDIALDGTHLHTLQFRAEPRGT